MLCCLPLAASQMWLLGRVLPLMVGHLVPEDDKWANLLLMLEITGYLFAPRLTSDEADYVALLIEEHHHAFCELYLLGSYGEAYYSEYTPT